MRKPANAHPAKRHGPWIASVISTSLLTSIALGVGPFLSSGFLLDVAHDRQRIAEAICLSMLLILGYRAYTDPDSRPINGWVAKFLFLFFLFGFFSCLNAYSPRHAFYEWSSFLLLFLLAWVIAREVSSERVSITIIVTIAGFGCAIYLFKILLFYLFIIAEGAQLQSETLVFGFSNYRFLNHVQTISVPILMLLILWAKPFSKPYWFWFAVSSLWWMMVFVTGARGTFVGLLAAGTIVWFCRKKSALPWCRLMVFTCIAGFVVYFLLFVALPFLMGLQPFGLGTQVIQRSLGSPTSGRLELWQLSWRLIVENPLLGVGPLHFARYGVEQNTAAHPHSWIFQIAVEWGVIALVCLVAWIAKVGHSLMELGKKIGSDDMENQFMLSAWIGTGAAILVDGSVSGLIVMPMSQLWIALYVGCAWGWARTFFSDLSDAPSKPKSPIRIPLMIGVFCLLALFWFGLLPEAFDILYSGKPYASNEQPLLGTRWPRMWSSGYF